MRWGHAATIIGACAGLAAGLVVLASMTTGTASPPPTPAPPDATAPASPRSPAAEPLEIFGVDPGRMLLYDAEQLRRDSMRGFEQELRRLRLPPSTRER